MPKPNLKCYICEKSIYVRPSQQNGHNVCSYSCRNKYYSGEKSFNKKHGYCINLEKGQRYNKDNKELKERDRITDRIRTLAYKMKAIEILGGECSKCGYNDCLASLDFHHIDPKTKNPDGLKMNVRSWNKLLKELNKCILLCSNCHREYHFKNGTGIKLIDEAKTYLEEKFKPRRKYKWKTN